MHSWKEEIRLEKLQEDSQMLEDLIRMLASQKKFQLELSPQDDWILFCHLRSSAVSDSIGTGSTPREAIAAAVKEWKK
jgi:hypothetical protein